MNEKFFMRLGILLHGIRFSVRLKRDKNSKFGYRGEMMMRHKEPEILYDVLGKEQAVYSSRKDIEKMVNYIEKTCNAYGCWNLLHDKKGLEVVKWALENPFPHDWESMKMWVVEFDEMMEKTVFL